MLSSTPEDAFATFLCHLTEGHMLTQHLNQAVMISISLPLRKLTILCCHNRVTQFLSGFLVEQFQLADEQVLGLTNQEIDNQRTWTMQATRANRGTIMDNYSWENNYVWSYNQVRNIETIVNNVNVDQKKVHAYFNPTRIQLCWQRYLSDTAKQQPGVPYLHAVNCCQRSRSATWLA